MLNTKQLLIACGKGEFPQVSHPILGIGQVVTIKNNGRNFGCSVKFEVPDYDVWFTDSQDTDKRTKYMRELTLI